MTQFHAEKCCYLMSGHAASARRICSSVCQFSIRSAQLVILLIRIRNDNNGELDSIFCSVHNMVQFTYLLTDTEQTEEGCGIRSFRCRVRVLYQHVLYIAAVKHFRFRHLCGGGQLQVEPTPWIQSLALTGDCIPGLRMHAQTTKLAA